MIILDGTNQSLVITLGSAVTTEFDWTASYVDITSSTYSPGSAVGTTNDTADVTMVSAPSASTQRQIKFISVYNADSSNRVVIIKKVNGVNSRILCRLVLTSQDTLQYTDSEGFTVIDNNGLTVTNGTNTAVSAGGLAASNLNTYIFSNTNGVSFGLNTNNVLTASVSGISVSFWDIPHGEISFANLISSITGPNLMLQRISMPFYMTVTRADYLGVLSGSTGANGSWTNILGFYARTGSFLSLVLSTTAAITYSINGTTSDSSVYSGQSGTRWRTIPVGSMAFSPGEYWVGFGIIASTSQTAFSLSIGLNNTYSLQNSPYTAELSANLPGNAVSNYCIYGAYVSGTTGCPNYINNEQIVWAANSAGLGSVVFKQPYLRFFGTH